MRWSHWVWQCLELKPSGIGRFMADLQVASHDTTHEDNRDDVGDVSVGISNELADCRIGIHPVQSKNLDIKICLFFHLANARRGDCFAWINSAAGEAPMPVVFPLLEKYSVLIISNNGGSAGDLLVDWRARRWVGNVGHGVG